MSVQDPGHGHQHTDAGHHDHDHGEPPGLPGRLGHLLRPHSHDAADSLDHALESSAHGIRAVKISLVALGVTALAQLAVVAISGSVALLADTIHNFSDALTALPLWLAFAIGRRAPTRRYTYGYGRAEDVAGLFVVAMIAMSAVVAGYESIARLIHPQPVNQLGWVALAGLLGFLGNEAVAIFRIRVGRQIGSAALVADGLHARTDGFTSLAVLIGAAGVAAGWEAADPLVGLLITVAILAVLRTAARDIFRRLMDAVDPDLIDAAESSLQAIPGVLSVRRVRMRWIGHEIHADADLAIDSGTSLAEAHQLAHTAEHELTHAVPKLATAVVHAYPRATSRPTRTTAEVRVLRRGRASRQIEDDLSTSDGRGPSVGLGDCLDESEPEAGASGGAAGVGAGEPVERVVDEVGGEPGPFVADSEPGPFVGSCGADPDGAFAVLQCVGDEVREGKFEPVLVPRDGQAGQCRRFEAPALRICLRSEAARDVDEELVDIDGVVRGFAGGAELFEVEEGVGQRDEPLDLAAQGLERCRGLGFASGAQQRYLELGAHQGER